MVKTHTLNDNYKIIKQIGMGIAGSIYLIEFDDNFQYALKKEKISEKYLVPHKYFSTDVAEWREIIFYETFANLHADQFNVMYDYKIEDNCKYIYNDSYYAHLNDFSSDVKQVFIEKEKSNYCILKLLDLVDTDIKKIKNYEKKVYYSIITQLIYICYLLRSNGFSHNDLHSGNIGMRYVNEYATLDILGYELKTFGIHIRAVGFWNGIA